MIARMIPRRRPESLLAASDEGSPRCRTEFIRTYLDRDMPQLGPRIPAETLRRFWTMLAHQQGGLLNAAAFALALSDDGKTIASYLDRMVDLLFVRRLAPWLGNTRKWLVKSPKVFVRDGGLPSTVEGLHFMALLCLMLKHFAIIAKQVQNTLSCCCPDQFLR